MRPITKQSFAIVALTLPLLGLLLLGAAFLRGNQDADSSGWRFVASLSELPDDGAPILKTVYESRDDTWLALPDRPICQVFVSKEPGTNRAFVVAAWHHDKLRIPLEFDLDKQQYRSCCWNVTFDLRGKRQRRPGRPTNEGDLAVLPVQITRNKIWVNLGSLAN